MVKISVLQHNPSSHLALRPGDPTPISRNLNPLIHPFARARERTRALNAVKMERMFAKPFIGALEGHVDAVECVAKRAGSVSEVASGSWDGGIVRHDLATRTRIQYIPQGHKGKVSGLCYSPIDGGDMLLSCGVDRTVNLWNSTSSEPVTTYTGKAAFNAISHHATSPLFATASSVVHIYDLTKSLPLSTLSFPPSTSTLLSLSFSPSTPSLLSTTDTDRSFTLYDIRTSLASATRRTIMTMRANSLSWNPVYPTEILMGSEDHNLYTWDLRSMGGGPRDVYKGHVAAVVSCEWAPTGQEFVSGGWDRTLRIWKTGVGAKERDVYHTKRMGRVTSALFTADAQYVLSGSDDGNVRIWKANASRKLGLVTARERAAIEYRDKLKERWSGVDRDVGRIARSRHVPKPVYQASKLKRTMLDARRVKEERRRKHTRKGESKPKAERKKVVVVEQT